MPEGTYLIGIDYGTGGVRVGIFDRGGEPAGFHAVEFPTDHPRPGEAEQDPGVWWSALKQAMAGAMEESGISADQVAGISTDAMASTVVAIDENDRHLRPAILWMDIRASEQADRLAATAHPALKYNGFGPVSAEWGLPKALWLKDEEPETFKRATHIVDCGDWLIQKLTGVWASSINIASSKFYYDRDEGGYPEGLYDAVDGADVLERLPQDVMDLGSPVGEGLSEWAARELGLKAGTPVAQGGIDAYLGALGLGVVEPGKIALITGSSHVMIGQSAEPIHDPGFWGAYTDAMIPGQYTVEAGQASTGSIVAWFKNKFAADAVAEGDRRGVDPYVILGEMARKIPIGCDGLLALDYFQGNRSPHTDPLARGMFWGLSLNHGPAHVFRAIIESICYGTELIFRTMRGQDFEPRMNVVSGGPAKSEWWMQMHADVSNIPIAFTKVSEGPVLGAAICAAVGAGMYPDIPSAVTGMVDTERTIEPSRERHEEYQFFLDRYIESYDQMKDVMHTTVRHVNKQLDAHRARAGRVSVRVQTGR
jgi:FGGY-family pentulose kinase